MDNIESKVSIRLYQKGDEEKILSLFELVFHKKMDSRYWDWMYRQNPAGTGIIALAFHDNKLISHYSVIPIDIIIDHRDAKAVFSLDTMTHPQYRGIGLFPKLAEYVYSEASRLGYEMVFGFPNSNSYGGFIKKLGWHGTGNMQVYSVSSKMAPIFETHGTIITKMDTINPANSIIFDKISQRLYNSYFFSVKPSQSILKWRYYDHPTVKYNIYLINMGKHPVGYFVLKNFISDEETKGHIIDFLIEDNKYFSDILNYSLETFNRANVPNVTFWCNPEFEKSFQFEKREIKKITMERTYFGFRSFNKELSNDSIAKNREKFHIVMGNSDVF